MAQGSVGRERALTEQGRGLTCLTACEGEEPEYDSSREIHWDFLSRRGRIHPSFC